MAVLLCLLRHNRGYYTLHFHVSVYLVEDHLQNIRGYSMQYPFFITKIFPWFHGALKELTVSVKNIT